ncbi:hypothetical protein BGZ63DRAFT_85405 [Mariannaea sp. PMI_226]|nr:hypothetical protein BGZ63DRAFT_85405 [Mariannaea sp. PMI_226]
MLHSLERLRVLFSLFRIFFLTLAHLYLNSIPSPLHILLTILLFSHAPAPISTARGHSMRWIFWPAMQTWTNSNLFRPEYVSLLKMQQIKY